MEAYQGLLPDSFHKHIRVRMLELEGLLREFGAPVRQRGEDVLEHIIGIFKKTESESDLFQTF
eukprot:6728191-Pyramimonas_sp.AAC.1